MYNNYNNTIRTCVRAKALSFRLDCVPPTATAQQKGAFVCGGRVRFFTKKKVRQSENFLAALLSMHAPDVPFSEPVAVTVRWPFPWRKSERKSVTMACDPIPHVSRPDLDNLMKMAQDAMMHTGYFKDDSQIAIQSLGKFNTDDFEGVKVSLEELEVK